MKNRRILLAIGWGLILTLIVPAVIPHVVSAQTICYDAVGKVITCPDQPSDGGGNKKKPTPTRQRIFPTATPTFTQTKAPTNTATRTATPGAAIPDTGGNDTSQGLTGPSPSASPFILIGLLLGGGLLLALFFVGQNRRNRSPGEERGALNAYSPPPDPEQGGTMNNNETTMNNNETSMNTNDTSMNNNEDSGSLTTNNE